MVDTPITEQLAASLPPAYAHTPEEAPPDQPREEPELAPVDPQALHRVSDAYGLVMGDLARTNTACSNTVGLEAQFPGGTVQISADAMARSADASDRAAPPPDETDTSDNDSNDAKAEPSPNGDNVTPDLGERVF